MEVTKSPVSAGLAEVLRDHADGRFQIDPSHDRESVARFDVALVTGQLQGAFALQAQGLAFVSLYKGGVAR